MAFKDDIPEFKSFSDGDLYMHTVPNDVWGSMESLIRKSADNAEKLKAVINNIAEITGGSITNNWGWDFLQNDIPDCVWSLKKKVSDGRVEHFEAFMDSLAVLHDVGSLTEDDIDEFLEDYGIGYRCSLDFFTRKLVWKPVEGTEVIEDILETQSQVQSLSQQAYDRFESALRQFEDVDKDDRARKDAIRSCIDAMEALIKELGGDDEIGQATKNLKDEKDGTGKAVWGAAELVKDGNNLFNLLHRLYPDVRHGTQDIATADMTMEEAEYFVGRITVFMKYIASRAKRIGRI